MKKMNEKMESEKGDDNRNYRGGKDKGMSPPFRQASEIGDGVNINVEADGQGRSIAIFSTGDNLTRKGEANYVGPFKEVAGEDGWLNAKNGYGFINENRDTDSDDEKGVK